MLALGLKPKEDIIVVVPPSDKPQIIQFVLVDCNSNKSKVGVNAAREIQVDRGKIYRKKLSGEFKKS